ncbi:hypothetical protein CP10139811_0710 [Chlamydia ibidis]|uniref:Uncharacterized protein n=2 Tax=Chlamydia ibidis TaxID=1405396 RepID=S7KJS6_9CHLA|nr:hypothetical protein CP10139811_0710 [Chlamydia ibidis]EQM63082.1 hypothetical protein H359_0030 [Chlamydia ibidis 10-1398/6]
MMLQTQANHISQPLLSLGMILFKRFYSTNSQSLTNFDY